LLDLKDLLKNKPEIEFESATNQSEKSSPKKSQKKTNDNSNKLHQTHKIIMMAERNKNSPTKKVEVSIVDSNF